MWTAPVGWDDLRAPLRLKEAIQRASEVGAGRFTFAGIVSSASFMPFRGRRGVRVVLQDVEDAACKLHAFWFFSAHGVLALAKPGAALLGIGKITVEPKKPPRTAHPDLFADGPEARIARPRYPRLGPKGALLRKAIAAGAPALDPAPDPIPAAMAAREGLPAVADVIGRMHALDGALPAPEEQARFVERLAWSEAFTRAWERIEVEEGLARTPAPVLRRSPKLVRELEEELGFELTADQRAACAVIAEELASERPMRRLLLGDVGTGKTAVALAAVGQAVRAGKQAAILAPTSVLAEQYVAAVRPLERAIGARAVLVAAGAAERGKAEKALASGEARIAIGTHALLGSAVTMPELGLVVVDEQQRLGVAQRLSLVRKGARPHLLTLSATPIPRTLALALRGELATTTLRERPAGRKPVSTTMLPKSAIAAVVTLVDAAAVRGERVFWVVPRVEDTGEDEEVDELASLTARVKMLRGALLAKLPAKRIHTPSRAAVGAIHGRMKPDEKREAMARFRAGETPVLVGTTVIEVGVDVPEATLMVIEDAEQFGLAQLHQLRGRVGRGARRGECILLHGDGLADLAHTRLSRLCALADGEEVAKADLELRGGGDLSGTRQHGDDEPLVYLDPSATWSWLERIEADARAIRAADRKLAAPEHRVLGSIVAKLRRAIAVREEAG